jgi:hypothetical protein
MIHDPLLSGDFQSLMWGRMLGSSWVAGKIVGGSTLYEEGDNPSVSATLD